MSKESCLILAGERSGEDHTLTFFDGLKTARPDCEFFGVGGERLEAKGVELLYNLRDFSGIGFSEIVGKIPFYYKAMKDILSEVDRRGTKTAILVDFQGFNLKLAKKLKKRGVNVLYYVAPQAWVWKAYRAKTLQKTVHTLFTILPFEKEWFFKRGVSKVKGVVHPLMLEHKKSLESVREKKWSDLKDRPARILLLPGSRSTEVKALLPLFEKALNQLKEEGRNFEVGIVEVESVPAELYQSGLTYAKKFAPSELAQACDWADVGVAASGTVTLATGLFGLPTVVCYKLSAVTEFIANLLIHYDGPVSLTNIVHQERLYPELIQEQADSRNIVKHLARWLGSPEEYDKLAARLASTKTLLSGEDFSVSEYMSQVIQSAHEN